MRDLRAADIHAQLGESWPKILAQLGIPEQALRLKKAGPCPACGGQDRYTFDNRKGKGDFICRGCGPGDGFTLLRRFHGWSFTEARRHVLEAARIVTTPYRLGVHRAAGSVIELAPAVATPPSRVRFLARSACQVADCPDAVNYLESRALWPLPPDCTLKAHPTLDYWREGERARHPGLVAEVRDEADELVTVHVTYLVGGRKLDAPDCRKLLSPLTGSEGCAVRLMPAPGETLGIAEGIETALSAAAIDGIPVWAALNTSLLAKFEPPRGCAQLVVYADRDEAGLTAALKLFERLQGRIRVEVRIPTPPAKDFNDQLTGRRRGQGHHDE
ncbi:MAG: toprim domain-containing protein [Proteobacteria bacterium]|nr:toprim domain-containing protein [Pseudomonadota bacterium]